MRLFQTELKKIRHRHIGLLYLGALAVTLLWMVWAMSDMDDVIIKQGYYYLFLSIPMINGVFLPTIIACVESRLCDMEIKGNTFKVLCTMQPRSSIYHIKLLLGLLYLFCFTIAETALIPILGICFHVRQTLDLKLLLLFSFSTFTVSLILMIMQQSLSLLSHNQLFPLFFGVGGTFIGIFSWFFPNLPIRYLLPWGYYCVGSSINMNYEAATHTVTYYAIPFPKEFFLCIPIWGIPALLLGRRLFMKKEI